MKSDASGNLRCSVNSAPKSGVPSYRLDQQIGYLLRLANQRHLEIFTHRMPELTPTQFSVLARLDEVGELSQNELGRRVGIDAATTNGVIERLKSKLMIKTQVDSNDKRRLIISLTVKGKKVVRESVHTAHEITVETLQGLTASEARQLTRLLVKLQHG